MSFSRNIFCALNICIYMTQVVTSGSQTLGMPGERFLHKLKQNIELQDEHTRSKEREQYTILRITGKDIGFTHLSFLYQSLLMNENDQDNVISLITIRKTHGNPLYSSDDYMKDFAKAMQSYVIKNEEYISYGNFHLTIYLVEQAHIEEFEIVNSRLEKIYASYRYFDRIVFEHFYEICYEAFLMRIVHEVKFTLSAFVKYTEISQRINIDDLIGLSKIDVIYIWANIFNFASENCIFGRYDSNFNSENSIFTILYNKLCIYEASIGHEYFVHKSDDLHDYLLRLFRVDHEEMFTQCTNDIAIKFFRLFNIEVYKFQFAEVYAQICSRLAEYMSAHQISTDPEYKVLAESFFAITNIREPIKELIHKIHLENFGAINESCETNIDGLSRELQNEDATRIIYSGKVHQNDIHQLCFILKDKNVFKKIGGFQSIYIDKNAILPKTAQESVIAMCDEIFFAWCPDVKRVEFYSATCPTNEDCKRPRLESFAYQRHFDDIGNNLCSSNVNTHERRNETMIQMNVCNDLQDDNTMSDSVNDLKLMCLERNGSKIVKLYKILIENDFGLSFIYFIQHKTIKTKKGLVSLIFDVAYEGQFSHGTSDQLQRRIKCLDNVLEPMLDNLSSCLQNLQLSTMTPLQITNLRFMDTIGYVYFETFTTIIGSTNPIISIENFMSTFSKYQNDEICTCYISIKEIVDFEPTENTGSLDLNRLLSHLNIRKADFIWILRKHLQLEPATDAVVQQNTSDKYALKVKVNLRLTVFSKNNVVLHICEIKEICYIHELIASAIKTLAILLDHKTTNPTLQALYIATRFAKNGSSFIACVLCDICKQINFFVKTNATDNMNLSKTEVISLIFANIESLFASIIDMSNRIGCELENFYIAGKWNIIDFQRLLNPKEIGDMADILIQSLQKLPRKRVVKITSIKINKVERQYEDLRYWEGRF